MFILLVAIAVVTSAQQEVKAGTASELTSKTTATSKAFDMATDEQRWKYYRVVGRLRQENKKRVTGNKSGYSGYRAGFGAFSGR